jgi:hypothetical protein
VVFSIAGASAARSARRRARMLPLELTRYRMDRRSLAEAGLGKIASETQEISAPKAIHRADNAANSRRLVNDPIFGVMNLDLSDEEAKALADEFDAIVRNVEPNPVAQAERYGPEMTLHDWHERRSRRRVALRLGQRLSNGLRSQLAEDSLQQLNAGRQSIAIDGQLRAGR